MKYSKPEILPIGSAVAVIRLQFPETKGIEYIDRLDFNTYGPWNSIADPPAYEADE